MKSAESVPEAIHEYHLHGYAVLRLDGVAELLLGLKNELSVDPHQGGQRNILLSNPRVWGIVGALKSVAQICLGDAVSVVRGILFDKQPGANWKLPFHQDRTIAVAEQIDAEGYSGWSVKEGIVHVRPPVEVLEKTVAIRVHLDRCHADNGALRVIPDTHKLGMLSADAIERIAAKQNQVTLEVGEGDIVLMSPLLLHASSPAVSPSHRRVIHLEYSSAGLPKGLQFPDWQDMVLRLHASLQGDS